MMPNDVQSRTLSYFWPKETARVHTSALVLGARFNQYRVSQP